MSLNSALETALLGHIFKNLAIPNIGDAAGLRSSVAAGSIFVSLHSQDPGDNAANQGVDELDYTGYARKAEVRSASGWTVSGDEVSNAAIITMGLNSGASQTCTNFGLGSAAAGATPLYLVGAVPLVISTNVNPSFAIGALDVSVN